MKWSKQEIEALKRLYPLYLKRLISREELMEVLPYRNWQAIIKQASLLRCNNINALVNKKKLNEILRRVKI